MFPTMPTPETPYSPLAQLCGTIRWVCPFCGLLSRSRITYGSYWVRCKLQSCHRKFLLGLTFYIPVGTRRSGDAHIPPPDVVIPDTVQDAETIRRKPDVNTIGPDALVVVGEWHNGDPIMQSKEL